MPQIEPADRRPLSGGCRVAVWLTLGAKPMLELGAAESPRFADFVRQSPSIASYANGRLANPAKTRPCPTTS